MSNNKRYNNCHNCKHSKILFEGTDRKDLAMGEFDLIKSNNNSVLGNMYGKCLLGHDDRFIKWWKDNGHKNINEDPDVLDCYEPHESLDKLNTTLNDILNKFKTNK